MTLNIHPDCKARLIEKLTEALAYARVNNKSFLNRNSLYPILLLESILPKSGEIRDNLESFIGESPLFDFVYGKLSRELNEKEQYNSDVPDEPLSENQKYSDLSSLSAQLVSELDSLPWNYCFTFRINGSIGKYFTDEFICLTVTSRLIIYREGVILYSKLGIC